MAKETPNSPEKPAEKSPNYDKFVWKPGDLVIEKLAEKNDKIKPKPRGK